MKFLRILLLFVTYPKRLAAAVNEAESVEEFDKLVGKEICGDVQ